MQPIVIDPLVSDSSILRRVLLTYLGLSLVSLTFSYLNGGLRYSSIAPLWHILGWAWGVIEALILDYSRRLCLPPRRGRIYGALYLAPALVQINRDVARFELFAWSSSQEFWLILSLLEIGLLLLGVGLLRSAYIALVTRLNTPTAESDVPMPSAHDISSTYIFTPSLGRGDGYIDRVIRSVLGRSMKSERVASFSLAIMLILVMIGGMASFGLWAFTQADRISTLKAERNKLVSLQDEIRGLRERLGAGSEDLKANLDRLLKFIEDNYKTSPTYEETLQELRVQSQTNAADIAIRVTIAVLTIFLVQVFFAVYKYNRHLSIMLAAKAEALELAGNDDEARKELSREAVSIVKEGIPGFGSQPRTPIEEAVQAAERLRKRE